MSRTLIWIVGLAGAILIAAVIAFVWVVLFLSDPDRATPFLQDQIGSRLESPTTLESGWVDVSWRPVVRLRTIAIEGRGQAATFDARVDPFGWLIGRRLVDHVLIEDAAYAMRLGRANGGPPQILDNVRSADLARVRLDILRPGRDPQVLIIRSAEGDLSSGDFVMQASGGESAIVLAGRAVGLTLQGFRGDLEVSGENFASFAALIGLPSPDTPPFTLSGALARDGQTWRFDPFDGVVGDSDLGGSLEADFSGDRPMVRADLVSQSLDFNDLGVIVGAPSEADGDENERQIAINRAYAASNRLIPQASLDFARIRAADAEVVFRADSVQAGVLPLQAMHFDMTLDNGVMRFDPLAFEAPLGGRLESRIVIDATQDVTRTEAEGTMDAFDLRGLGGGRLVRGDLAGRYELAMTGSDLRSAFASADGQVVLWAHPDAQLRRLASVGAGLNVLEVVLILLREEEDNLEFVPVRCAAARFTINDGVAVSNPIVIDTEDSLITMDGQVSLHDERIALVIHADAKAFSWGHLLGGVRIGGTLRNPSGQVQAFESLLQGGAAALLAGIAGPLALLPFIDPGLGEDAPCGRLMARATGQRRGFTDAEEGEGPE